MTPEQLKQVCKDRYCKFAELLQDEGWFDPIHRKLCDWIQWNIQEGLRTSQDDIKLAIVMPRGALKSTIVTKYLPIWMSIGDPNIRVLVAGNTFPNSRKKLEDIRGVFDSSQTFRALFPELLPKPWSRWTNDCAEINRTQTFPEGTFEAAGMKTQLTGRHYSMIIEDDTLAPSESDMGEEILSPSKEEIEKGINFHKATTYLYPPKGTRISIVVTTRWSDDDLIAYITQNENYKIFDMPAMDKTGKCNFTCFYSPAKLEEIKAKVGPYMFSCNPATAPITMADFSQRPISQVVPGDEILGFILGGVGKGKNGEETKRRLVKTKVLSVNSRVALVSKIVLRTPEGSFKEIHCTREHNWFTGRVPDVTNPKRKIYAPAKPGNSLMRVFDQDFEESIWNLKSLYLEECAWLGGIFDGEGHCKEGSLFITQSESHNPEVCQRIRLYLKRLDFIWHEYKQEGGFFGSKEALTFAICGREQILKFLKLCNPCKSSGIYHSLLLHWSKFVKGKDRVISIEDEKEEPVYALETETGNYIVWGYASKNCLYLNSPLDASQKVFKPEWFKYVYESEIPENNPEGAVKVWRTIAVDPAISEKDKACDTAITEICHVTEGNRAFDYWTKAIYGKFDPFVLIKKTLDLAQSSVNTQDIIVESNAYQASLKYYFADAMVQRKCHFNIIPVHSKTDKDLRIQGMVPYFSGGRIFLVRGLAPQVESQLRQYPNGKFVDVIDSFSMHRRFSGKDKLEKPISQGKKKLDPLSGEAILKELRVKYNLKNYGKKNAPREVSFMGGLKTGLSGRINNGSLLGGVLR